MKKLAMVILMMTVATSVYAMAKQPKPGQLYPDTSLMNCVANSSILATRSGLVSPWAGGDLATWTAFVQPLDNECVCKYLHRPLYTVEGTYSCN